MLAVYRLSPDLVIERFADSALILLSSRDRFLTVNHSAAGILTRMQEGFHGLAFSTTQLATLLRTHYRLGEDQAHREAGGIVSSWAKQGILTNSEST